MLPNSSSVFCRDRPQTPDLGKRPVETVWQASGEVGHASRHMTVGQLKIRYREAFGEDSRSNHKQFLFRRIAWRIQANAEGGLSERARRRALEIANDADLRIRAPKNFLKGELDPRRTAERSVEPTTDPRLPTPGTMLVRRYR